jgi:hypothetical protein
VPSKKPGGWSSLMKPLPRRAHQTQFADNDLRKRASTKNQVSVK